jgi:hypothetical protein
MRNKMILKPQITPFKTDWHKLVLAKFGLENDLTMTKKGN